MDVGWPVTRRLCHCANMRTQLGKKGGTIGGGVPVHSGNCSWGGLGRRRRVTVAANVYGILSDIDLIIHRDCRAADNETAWPCIRRLEDALGELKIVATLTYETFVNLWRLWALGDLLWEGNVWF